MPGETKWNAGPIIIRSYLAFLTLSAAGCAEPLFPPAAVKDLNPALQMGIFNPEADTYFKGHLVQVGGRIVTIEQRTGR